MDIELRIKRIQKLIHETELACHRPSQVTLLAVSKGQSISKILQAYQTGLRDFAESYLQEALPKIKALPKDICWHFIGPVQSNKSSAIAHHFSWVHSISRIKIAELLAQARPPTLPPLNICIQIRFADNPTQAGLLPTEILPLANHILQLRGLKLRGLMVVPKRDQKNPAAPFQHLHQLKQTLNQQLGINMDTLSMGMSDDCQVAIEAGSTLIRIGTAIFGQRNKDLSCLALS